MFLDDELSSIYEEHKDNLQECCQLIYNACIDRIDKTPNNFINSIKKIDASYRLFAKKNNKINPDFLKTQLMKVFEKDEKGNQIIKLLNW